MKRLQNTKWVKQAADFKMVNRAITLVIITQLGYPMFTFVFSGGTCIIITKCIFSQLPVSGIFSQLLAVGCTWKARFANVPLG